MVASVGSISIDLSTNAQKFASGFKSAATTVESQSARMAKSVAAVERGVTSIGGTLKTFVGGLAAGAGIASIASLSGAFDTLKQTISEYDEIATNAKQTGLNTDTYQSLAFAAKQANVEQESFNTALTIFAKNAGLAERGTGALYSSLQKLNPQLLQNIVNTKDQETRLKLVADALAQTTDASQKAALAAAVFGKGGVEMARFLDQGSASIEAMKKAAKDLGIVIPDDLLQRAGDIDNKLDELAKIIHVQLGEAVINLVPVLEKATIGFANFSKSVNTASSALTNFVNDPSWATLEKLVVSIGGEPFKENSLLGHLANGTMDFGTSAEDISAITKGIDFLKQKIAELQALAAKGADVHVELTDAQQSLNDLELRLRQIQGVGVSAANEIRASFAEAFRAAENASMDALASMRGAAAPGSLPNVTRYGGNPNQIELPDQSRNVQTNVNGSGVNVTKYSSDTADNTKDTAGYTQETADNVTSLDQNTNSNFRRLTDAMGRYSSNEVTAISGLGASFAAAQYDALDAITAQMVQAGLNTGSISQPSNMFGDQWDSQHGSHVGPILNGGIAPHYSLGSMTSGGSSDTQVSVAQPGSDITLNYYAAPGESTETAKQRAREMFNELTLQASRA
ncbi:hypothetical protein [Mesorhizobium sp. AA23]|uniref:hypothetical protein n=1 Tax=Mesorhizobium sp. AA23 TaxID=1854058 RepID=UPI0007FEC9A9|nr:hypothetical protein [Mesorhizobium sp. AA23]OBQ94154.1 hypothetical protein A9K66_27935 [Mesorhizobium sp. AA23]